MQHLYAVQSIAELREFDPFYSAQLRTSGYRNPGDGGGVISIGIQKTCSLMTVGWYLKVN